MPSHEQRVVWSADGSQVVRSVAELYQVLDQLAGEHGTANPSILITDVPSEEGVFYGVGGDVSFVSSCDEPYLTTVGEDSIDGQVDYFFQGHHSPVERKHLIPAPNARKIIQELFVTGRLPLWQEWKPSGSE